MISAILVMICKAYNIWFYSSISLVYIGNFLNIPRMIFYFYGNLKACSIECSIRNDNNVYKNIFLSEGTSYINEVPTSVRSETHNCKCRANYVFKSFRAH